LDNVHPAVSEEVPLYRLALDYDRLTRWGVQPATVERYVETSIRGREVTALRGISEDVPILLHAGPVSLERLLRTRLPTEHGSHVPLGEVVRVEAVREPAALLRSDQRPVLRVLADLADGADLRVAERAVADAAA